MKPLSRHQKDFLYKQFVFGHYRFIAKPLYDFAMMLLLMFEKTIDLFDAHDDACLEDLTIIIKTFERHYSAKRLIRSIKNKYPDIGIIVVNDSKQPQYCEGVENLIMPFDSGISAGRNAALNVVNTRYFLLLDDDFVFSRRQNLGHLIAQMNEHRDIDILGGRCIDLPFYITHDFHEHRINSKSDTKVPFGTIIGDNKVVDKIQNYFIARTESVKKILWDEQLKTLEHTDFFTRAKGKLVTAYHPDIQILHAKTPFDIAYLSKRFRLNIKQK